jgi:hypothetical protein
MNQKYALDFENFYRWFIKKNLVYVIIGILVFMNLVFFPDLLNHKDIKLNELSHMALPHQGKNFSNKPIHKEKDIITEKPAIADEKPNIQVEHFINSEGALIMPLIGSLSYESNDAGSSLFILLLLLLFISVSFGIFVNYNIETIKRIFNDNQADREKGKIPVSNNGYELLQD